MKKRFQLVALGGSFDHFHLGHEQFIKFASELGQELLIGVTKPHLIANKNCAHSLESLRIRKAEVKHFCKINHIQVRLIELDDVYGTTLENPQVDALAVTVETQGGADKINQARKVMSLPVLPIFIMDLIKDEAGLTLHSDRIRAGQVNRQGQVYLAHFQEDVTLNQQQRLSLQQPWGEIVTEVVQSNQVPVCVVGDTALENFINQGWEYDLGIYDGKRQRQAVKSEVIDRLQPDLVLNNPANQITRAVWENLPQALKGKTTQHVKVEGEEDLLTAALVLMLPLDAYIYYGQPDQGMVELKVTEEAKERVFQTLKKS